MLGVAMPAVLIRQGRGDSKALKTEKGVIRGVFMRPRFIYEPFEAICFFGVRHDEIFNISSLRFSNRASTNVMPKQKKASHKIYFGVTIDAYSNHHVRNF